METRQRKLALARLNELTTETSDGTGKTTWFAVEQSETGDRVEMRRCVVPRASYYARLELRTPAE